MSVTAPTCHPEKEHQAHGLCTSCYQKAYKDARREEVNRKERERSKRRSKDPVYKHKRFVADIKKKYGLSLEQYNNMLEAQNGKCKLCKHPPAKGKRLHIDHCHISGKIRGLLCAQCNWFVGKIDKNPEMIWEIVYYNEGNDNGSNW